MTRAKYAPHSSVRTKNIIPVEKVHAFKKVFKIICERAGGYVEAISLCGISESTITRMNKGFLSEDSARKIMDGYSKLKT